MEARLLTPSKITAWLDCEHFLTLQHRVDEGILERPSVGLSAFAELLMAKGRTHEEDCLAAYRDRGLEVHVVPDRARREKFVDWVARIGDPLAEGADVIYQMPFIHDGVRGIADFLIRVKNPQTGDWGYEPVDAKLARVAAKPGHILQLCFYAEAIEAQTGFQCENLHVWLGSGRFESVRHQEVQAYWSRMRSQLRLAMETRSDTAGTTPEPCDHCDFCEFAHLCEEQWREADSLIYVAGIRGTDRDLLDADGVNTLAALADPGLTEATALHPARLARLQAQASLQVEARGAPDAPPPYTIVPPTEDPTWGRGFELMPSPSAGDVFLDFEGHPFWRADTGLFFLFGFIAQEASGEWAYTQFWAHDLAEEAAATTKLVQYFVERRTAFPQMHIYHYNHTERSGLETLALKHGVAEDALADLVQTGAFIDLLMVVRNALQVGTESYSLKYLEHLAKYERVAGIEKGAGAVVEYERFMQDGGSEKLESIAAYNEDDVRATRALRDWLLERRPDLPWRAAVLEPEDHQAELNEQVAALHAFGQQTPEHLLGDILGYWRRERRANLAPKLGKLTQDIPSLLDEDDCIGGLVCTGPVERLTKSGNRSKVNGMGFSFPEQEVGAEWSSSGVSVLYAGDAGIQYARVDEPDLDARLLVVQWNEHCEEAGTLPTVVVVDDWVRPEPKPTAARGFADQVLGTAESGEPNLATTRLLRRELPRFAGKHGPAGGLFGGNLDGLNDWVCHLENGVLAVQGPPGTGKTYRGAYMILALIEAGRRVGITAMSHKAIDNLLAEVLDVASREGKTDLLSVIRKARKPSTGASELVKYASSNPQCAKQEYNLVAGTSWLFANTAMQESPVDVLFIDEAGQFALADAVACLESAQSLVLLGDPLQLPQVTQASHPGGAGQSVLGHLLDGEATMPADRGVFLDETRRMHPDVCGFISKYIYGGRLSSHPSCAKQSTEWGTGLRWLEVEHEGNSTEAIEEAEAVAARVSALIGTKWVDNEGIEANITAADIMVVAPYNDQVNLMRSLLDANDLTADVQAGTVDKFQGRQAAVVFFMMTTSSSADMPRGSEFLFSRNRLNVAVSRAQCLAVLVCTEELLNARAHTVEEMRLIATLCAFEREATRLE